MSKNAQEIYSEIVLPLSPIERLRLATLILNDLVKQDPPMIDQQDTWTQEDQLDITAFSLQYAGTLFPEKEELQ